MLRQLPECHRPVLGMLRPFDATPLLELGIGFARHVPILSSSDELLRQSDAILRLRGAGLSSCESQTRFREEEV